MFKIKRISIQLYLPGAFVLSLLASDKIYSQTIRGVYDLHVATEGASAGIGIDYFAVDEGTLIERVSCIPKGRSCPSERGYMGSLSLLKHRGNEWGYIVDIGKVSASPLPTRSQLSFGLTSVGKSRRIHLTLKNQINFFSLYFKPAYDVSQKMALLDIGIGVAFY
ncbi:MAG: hypothetical protein NT027_04360 [Proteobacteria bacterium]|nr:hypothetical protein [Pseudomonadota bacterium]